MEARKPKVFIHGASGFLGYNLALHLRKKFLVTGSCFHHMVNIPDAQIFPIDPKKPEILETLVRIHAPDLVINAVGINDRKAIAASPKVADMYNILAAVSLGVLSNKLRATFVQLSCALVYDGSDGNYAEDDLDFSLHDDLAKQKLAAESFIRAQTMESNVLRVGTVLGLGQPYRLSDFDRLRILLSAKKIVEAPKKTVHSYLSARSFVKAVELVLSSGHPGRHRLLNLGGCSASEFDMYQGWAALNGQESLVKPAAEDYAKNYSIQSNNFVANFPDWKPETKEEVYLNLMRDLNPAIGVKKWQKILQIP